MSASPTPSSPASALADQLFRESNAMVRFALSNGQVVPPKVIEIVETANKASSNGP